MNKYCGISTFVFLLPTAIVQRRHLALWQTAGCTLAPLLFTASLWPTMKFANDPTDDT